MFFFYTYIYRSFLSSSHLPNPRHGMTCRLIGESIHSPRKSLARRIQERGTSSESDGEQGVARRRIEISGSITRCVSRSLHHNTLSGSDSVCTSGSGLEGSSCQKTFNELETLGSKGVHHSHLLLWIKCLDHTPSLFYCMFFEDQTVCHSRVFYGHERQNVFYQLLRLTYLVGKKDREKERQNVCVCEFRSVLFSLSPHLFSLCRSPCISVSSKDLISLEQIFYSSNPTY